MGTAVLDVMAIAADLLREAAEEKLARETFKPEYQRDGLRWLRGEISFLEIRASDER